MLLTELIRFGHSCRKLNEVTHPRHEKLLWCGIDDHYPANAVGDGGSCKVGDGP